MRRSALARAILPCAALAACGGAATAHAAPALKLDMRVSPRAGGTIEREQPLKLDMRVAFSGEGLVAPDHMTMLLPAGLQVNTPLFPGCTEQKLLSSAGGKACPKASRVGSGEIQGSAAGIRETLKMEVYNGQALGMLLIHVTATTPVPFNNVITTSVTAGEGAASPVGLLVPVPDQLKEPAPTLKTTLESFSLKIAAERKLAGRRVGFISRVKCPPGGARWGFSASFGDVTVTDRRTVGCR